MPEDSVYHPPRTLLGVMQSLSFSEALKAGDARYVPTQEARGSQRTLRRLALMYGLDLASNERAMQPKKHVLFFGHIGSGKTTELRRYAEDLHRSDRFHVVEIDTANALDRNNTQYADILMVMARTLLERIESEGLSVGAGPLQDLRDWFAERIFSTDQTRDFSLEIKSGAEVKAEIPLLAKLFSSMTAAFKNNTSHKNSLRMVVRDSFDRFADIFNSLLRECEAALRTAGLGQRVLFIVDGTDKIRLDDTKQMFVYDADQLLAIDTLALYTAPLALKYEGLNLRLQDNLVLPMIKPMLREGTPFAPGLDALRQIVLRRADVSLFATPGEVDTLVTHCGGHPRELLRLLDLSCQYADGDRIDASAVQEAIESLAAQYRPALDREDYALLKRIDGDNTHTGNDDRTRRLLYNLTLMEYNNGTWRRSHPVVRTLEGYKLASAADPGAIS